MQPDHCRALILAVGCVPSPARGLPARAERSQAPRRTRAVHPCSIRSEGRSSSDNHPQSGNGRAEWRSGKTLARYREEDLMKPYLRALAASLALVLAAAHPVLAQKHGGLLRLYSPASPASMSNLEEATIVGEMPTMGVFNNLILFDQQGAQVSLHSINPGLATSWTWNEDGTELTFQLRQGVKWHDGKPVTAQDVTCTWALYQDKAPEKLRVNPRKSTYDNVDRVTTNGDLEVTFHCPASAPMRQKIGR